MTVTVTSDNDSTGHRTLKVLWPVPVLYLNLCLADRPCAWPIGLSGEPPPVDGKLPDSTICVPNRLYRWYIRVCPEEVTPEACIWFVPPVAALLHLGGLRSTQWPTSECAWNHDILRQADVSRRDHCVPYVARSMSCSVLRFAHVDGLAGNSFIYFQIVAVRWVSTAKCCIYV